ncbi:polo-like kinase [Penicillium brasilianum]|uniref:Polo-like kinase n=1 Tax=Penicillium brasilianum TaxID=104259 RepID=A0A1S9R7W3_PENBI|nr:polo-like kinase [Penicillium brasilianum]
MEALSPRTTNQMIKPKAPMDRKIVDKNAVAAAPKSSSASKNHADPPPSIVTEPEEDGERYSIGGFLGKGGFAVCYEGTLARNGRVFAMKVVKSQMPQKKMEEKFRTELQIHSKMRHPFIVQFYRAFAFEQSTYVVLELCPNGSVMDMVRKRRCLSLPEVRRFMIQLCAGVKYLHKRFVAHRDLKMGNLFLDRNMNIKIGDFGLAAMILSDKDAKRRNTLCGTPNYIAPEVLDKSKGGHTQKVDIWSLGVICFAMLTGYPPFQSKTQEEIYKKVRNLTYVWPKESENSNFIPGEAKDLVSACLNLVDEERPDPDDIVEHPFFNMYDGCIPRQLDPACRFNKPIWLKDQSPRGDSMVKGYGLDSDEKLRAYVYQVDDPSQRYHSCRAAFYSLCGVGRKPDGTARKSVGRNCSKSAYSECETEDARGLRPVVPLPMDFVYRWPHEIEGDWCLMESSRKTIRTENSAMDSSTLSRRSVSVRTNAVATTRTNAALAAAQQRRMESQNHAATLRQQARPGMASVRKAPVVSEFAEPSAKSYREPKVPESTPLSCTDVPAGGLAERPVRTRRMVSASNAATLRENVVPQLAKSTSMPSGLTIGKTRSQSRRLEAAGQGPQPAALTSNAQLSAVVEEGRTISRQASLRSMSRSDTKIATERVERPKQSPTESAFSSTQLTKPSTQSQGLVRTDSKSSKARSSLGLSPIFHQDDVCQDLPGTSLTDVNTNLRLMLANLVTQGPTRRRVGSRKQPHAYVIKWVDYTNRYGIGYVLDDGSVGCVFKGENGQPATSVVVRDGERHIRRKARSVDTPEEKGIPYSEADQLVPRAGVPVEFYENRDDNLLGCRGIRRAFIDTSLFDAKHSKVMKLRANSGSESERSDVEKIKRVKLVDQFGKYMIGSLGRHGDEGITDDTPAPSSGQFIKFYQRLGNVGIWGFGDGAFQFNFPDHTKLVLAPGRTRSSSPWIDFYHLSPSAARYFTAKGKMHPSGFDTRAVASDEAATFLSIANGESINSVEDRIRDILDANSFLQKISFIRDVIKVWIKYGRLGGRPSPSRSASGDQLVPAEMFWQGTQDRSSGGTHGTKFVWVTVGAPDGDGAYRSILLKDGDREKLEKKTGMDYDREMDLLKERLRVMGRE